MRSLLGRLWNNTLHLEGKFIRTSWQLFVPGLVTLEFFKGKQDRYPHPIRMFAIVMFLFLFLLNTILKQKESRGEGELISYETNRSSESGDSIISHQKFSQYERLKYGAMLHDLRSDYERMPVEWKTPPAEQLVDSLLRLFSTRYLLGSEGLVDSLLQGPLDSIGFGMPLGKGGFGGVQVASLDLVRYSPEEIIQRFHITHWLEKLVLRQGIKSYKNPEGFIHAGIGSLTWAILALIAGMSGVLALLYGRQNRYYVEHFIFLLHFHTGGMLLLLVTILGNLFGIWGAGVIGMAAFLPIPGMYFALKRYYGQGWFKTLIKWQIYSFFYLIAFVLLFVLGMAAVFALY